MSVAFICPRCSTAHTAHGELEYCPKCQHQLPQHIRLEVGAAIARQSAPRPIVLRLAGVVATVSGASMLLAAGLALTEKTPIQGGLLMVLTAVLGATGIIAGEGVRRERPWARPLMATYWPLLGLLAAREAVAGEPAVVMLWILAWFVGVPAAAAVMYLYLRLNVTEYYDALKQQDVVDNPRERP